MPSLNRSEEIRALQEELRRAQAVTPALMAGVLALAAGQHSAPRGLDKVSRLGNLIRAEAWTDAALALLELGLPQWKLRRVAYEDGEWHCCLGKQWSLPAWLDDVVEVSHRVRPLAIVSAIVQACSVTSGSTEAVRTVPSVPPTAHDAMCCDNFY